jgi:hypothetical protein
MPDTTKSESSSTPTTTWPLEVRCVIESLCRKAPVSRERRASSRADCRMETRLWITAGKEAVPVVLYLRDYSENAVSFVTEACLRQGMIAELEMKLSSGKLRRVRCVVSRSRQFRDGWFEGVLQCAR